MGVVTSILPRGASDYCDFIFTAAKNCLEAVDIVSKHTKKVLKWCEELDKVSNNLGINHAAELQKNSREGSPGKWIF